MKKLFIFTLFLILGFNAFANDNTVFKVSMLIEEDLEKNRLIIQNNSSVLSSTEKMMIYDKYEKDSATVPFLCNFLLGVGIGSFIQGDTKGGLIGLSGELLGLSIYLSGSLSGSAGAASLGALLLLGTRIYELVQPFNYRKNYNSQLRDALGLFNLSFNITPTLNKDSVMVTAMTTVSLI